MDEVCKYPVSLTAQNKRAVVAAAACLLIPWLFVHFSLDSVPFYHIRMRRHHSNADCLLPSALLKILSFPY